VWRWVIRAAVSAVVVTILLMVIPLRSVLDALGRISMWTWLSSLCIFFAGHYLNAVKLRLLIGAKRVPLTACVRAQYAGLVANLGLPGLAGGDLVRAAYLARTAGTRRVALASVADRLIDTLTIVVLIAVALPIAGVPPAIAGLVTSAGWWILGAAIGAAALGALVIRLRKHAAIAAKIEPVWSELRARRFAVGGAVLLSLLVQSAFVMTNVWLARQVGVTTGLAAWFVAWPLSKLIAVLPISLGGIGVREAALVSLLAPYGAPREAVLASGILWQAVLIVTGLAGLLLTQLLPRTAASPAGIKASTKGA
jgi:uncharacterized membrane protein YbhN (UPF0104 family)